MLVNPPSPSSTIPSAAPTEGTSILSDEVEVRDFTSTGEGGSMTPSSVYQSGRSPGASIFSDVTYDGDRATPRYLDNNNEFRPDSGAASQSLAHYRLRQRRRRRRRRRRAVVAVALLFLLTTVVFLLKGTELVQIANDMSGGRIARAVAPFIDEPTAVKYGLAQPPKTTPGKTGKQKAATKSQVKKKTEATSEDTIEASTRKRSQNDKRDTKQAKMNPNNAKSTAAALNAETEKMNQRRRAICNIPFSYVFYRPCWQESRSLPLDMSFLESTMQ